MSRSPAIVVGHVISLAVVLPLTGCGAAITGNAEADPAATFTVVCGLTLHHPASDYTPSWTVRSSSNSGSSCAGTNGFADIREAADVVVYGSDGHIVGSGQLDPGTVTGTDCVFLFTVDSVRYTSGPWQYEITHRGKAPDSPPTDGESGLCAVRQRFSTRIVPYGRDRLGCLHDGLVNGHVITHDARLFVDQRPNDCNRVIVSRIV